MLVAMETKRLWLSVRVQAVAMVEFFCYILDINNDIMCLCLLYGPKRNHIDNFFHFEERTKAYNKSKESNIVMAFLMAKDRFYSITG